MDLNAQILLDDADDLPMIPPVNFEDLSLETKANSAIWEMTLAKIIPAIVSIRSIGVRAFDTESQRTSQATGFVVDSSLGIILTNRHVVQPGPILADAIFNQSKEEIKLIPIYRDPVHDFGFFKFEVNDVKYMNVSHINLAPDKARVGLDIRVVGNDSGERLSILGGTIARLDRKAPNYGTSNYCDWNTFYYQSASMTSGGSSGSPVLDIEGNAVALNAGGATKAASSFFLPLDRVVRALKLIQSGELVLRGTLQTIIQHSPYDELKRLGLNNEIESTLRSLFKTSTGMLTVEQVLPHGPADKKLEAGDILLKINDNWITDFIGLESIFDNNIGASISVQIQRGDQTITSDITVMDLTSITPFSYVEVSGGILHTLSYQMARSYMVPVKGVFVASAGYMLGQGGVGKRCIIKSLNNLPTPNLEAFISIMNALKDNERVPIQFYQLSDINKMCFSIVQVDRRWHSFRMAVRNDSTGYWDYSNFPKCIGEATYEPQSATGMAVDENLGPAKFIIPSLVQVQSTLPFKVDGVTFQHCNGVGLVLDAKLGYVLVDRKICPTSIGDFLITFANSIIIPAKMVYLHQLFNFVIIQYDPSLIGTTPVKSAVLADTMLGQGDSVHLVCLTKTYDALVRKTIVTNIRQFFITEAIPPAYRPMNLEGIEIENPIAQGGVLCTTEGEIQAIHSCFTNYTSKKVTEFHIGIDVNVVKPVLEGLRTGLMPSMYTLEAELTYIQIAQARVLGLSPEWVKRIEDVNSKRRKVILLRRLTSGVASAELLKSGDMILSVNGKTCTAFSDITDLIYDQYLDLIILREGQELSLKVPLSCLESTSTERVVGWAGAIFQMPHKSVFQQLQKVPNGVMCSVLSNGSPAQLYRLAPLDWVTHINEREIKDLDDFLDCVSKISTDTFVRLKTVNYSRFEKVVTIRTDSHYFGLWQLTRDNQTYSGWKLESF
ncbi:hypothetical protein BC833DRAFT_571394 [Globomyces pollinis-pini]|nr:hypothetical protein BC833DRAFT_571394 [Globomyces pollinis-pini]